MGKGRNKQLLTNRLKRITKVIVKPKGRNKDVGKITDATRVLPKNSTHLRDRTTIKRLKMYNEKPSRNRRGEILRQKFMSRTCENPVSRIHPDRRWFGNTKIITQKQLQIFREQISKQVKDPYTIVLKHKKVPYGLLNLDTNKVNRMNLLQVESFDQTFGPGAQRRKPKLKLSNLENLAAKAEKDKNEFQEELDAIPKDQEYEKSFEASEKSQIEPIFLSGQSQRIKNELYKVIDSSDVILEVLDGRDPMGTRSPHIEKYLRAQCPHKHLVLVINKVDLVPTWCTQRWIKILSQEYPTIAFHASITNSFGKGALISLLRQFRLLHQGNRTLSVGVIGYPNSGKSSIINTLVGKPSCSVAPIPGQTKVWQYISLFDKFYLIDCPGVVYPRPGDDPATKVLRSVVRVELIEEPMIYVDCVLQRVRKEYLQKVYDMENWTDSYDFMKQLAMKRGKLLKGGEPDYHNISVAILHDWQRGRLPWFVCPPFEDDLELQAKLIEMEQQMDKERKTREEDGDLHEQFQPINTITDIKQSHDFFMDQKMSVEERAFLEINEDDEEKEKNEKDQDRNFVEMTDFTVQQKQEINNIIVDNPLKLKSDDPLLWEMKLKIWQKKRSQSL